MLRQQRRHNVDVETDAEIAEAIIKSVVAATRALGLNIEEPLVLGAGANVVLHLAPSPVVARIATLTADMRGGATEYLRRERDISAALVHRGVNTIGPTDLVDPGPHEADGRSYLLLSHRQLQPVDLNSTRDAKAVGRSLVELLAALVDLPTAFGDGDEGQPWEEITTLLQTIESTAERAVTARLTDTIQVLRECEPEDAWQLVHGDAHRVNVAFTEQGVTWFDFEDANRRPMAWDLATLRRAWPTAGDEACRLLRVDPTGFSMRWHHELREIYALLWNLLYAQRYEKARKPTADRLSGWLARPNVRRSLQRRPR